MSRNQTKKKQTEKKHSKKYGVWLGIAAAVFVLWILWANTALMVSRITVSDSRIPAAFSGFRIAQVSDLHNAEFGRENAELIRRLEETEPDIIVITGDLVDAVHTDADSALAFVGRAARIAPVYCVTGNHEAALPQYDALKRGMEEAGAVVLEDEKIYLEREGGRIALIGLMDPDFTVRGGWLDETPAMVGAKLDELLEGETVYTILLSHRPELFETYAACGVDLVLSGHAHGGQFRLPFIGGLIAPNQGFFPRHDAGLYTMGDTDMVVSRGLGNSIIPIRLNNRPELVTIELAESH